MYWNQRIPFKCCRHILLCVYRYKSPCLPVQSRATCAKESSPLKSRHNTSAVSTGLHSERAVRCCGSMLTWRKPNARTLPLLATANLPVELRVKQKGPAITAAGELKAGKLNATYNKQQRQRRKKSGSWRRLSGLAFQWGARNEQLELSGKLHGAEDGVENPEEAYLVKTFPSEGNPKLWRYWLFLRSMATFLGLEKPVMQPCGEKGRF